MYRSHSGTRNVEGLSRNSHYGLANVAHHATRQSRLVFNEDAEVVNTGHVVAGQHALDAGNCTRSFGIDTHDPCVGMWTSQNLHVQHVGHEHVGCVLDRTCDFCG